MSLSRHDGPGRAPHHSPTPREDALVVRLQSVGTRLAAAPAEEHRTATRARLVAMAAVRPPGGGAVRAPVPLPRLARLLRGGSRRRGRLSAGLAGAALAVSALGGVLAVSQDAAPGDLLYDVKRGGEQTRLALASDATRGRTLLQFASTRLTELTALTRDPATAVPAAAPGPAGTTAVPDGDIDGDTDGDTDGDIDGEVVADTLATMDRQTTQGAWEVTTRSVAAGDPAALADLATWAAGQETGLAALSAAVPEPVGPALRSSTGLATAVADRAAALVTALGCGAGPATTGTDDLGPLPAPCSPATTRTATREGAGGDAEAGSGTGDVATDASADPPGAGTAEPGPAPAASPARASAVPDVPVPPGTAGEAPGYSGGAHGGAAGTAANGGDTAGLPSAPTAGKPGPDRLPVPTPPRAATPAPPRSSTPPVIDLPLPLCVSALGLPILC
ncbi:DUF5667 domain-containing protein [Modestobacter lapidis]|nr:hypothetical protein [Modestobacter lapidis]